MVAEDYELDACTGGPSPRAPGLGCLSQAEEIGTRIWILCLVCLKITLPPSLSPPARQDQAPSQHSLLSHASCGAKEILLTYPLLRTLPGLPCALEITSKLPTSMESSSRHFRPTGQPRLPGLTPHSALGSPPLILAHAISCLESHPRWPQFTRQTPFPSSRCSLGPPLGSFSRLPWPALCCAPKNPVPTCVRTQ